MNKRHRGRSRRPNNNQNNNPNKSLDSNGPDVRVRGSAKTIYDKYVTLARDATSSGQRVKAENYLQHAEHYLRIVNELQAKAAAHAEQQQARQQQHQQQQNARRQKTESENASKAEAIVETDEASEVATKEKGTAKTSRGSKSRRTSKAQTDTSAKNGKDVNGDADEAPKPRTRRKKAKAETSADTELTASTD